MRNARWFFVVATLLISGRVAAEECAFNLEAACQRNYERQSGTMYQSMEAVCEANAALAFARKHGPRK